MAEEDVMSIRWYNKEKEIVEKIEGAGGKERAPTTRDAKKLGLFPSVTSVLGILDKPGLNRWKTNQVVSTIYNNRELLDGSEKQAQYLAIKEAEEKGQEAALFGTAIHEYIEDFFKAKEGEDINIDDNFVDFVSPVLDYFIEKNVEGIPEEKVIIEAEGLKSAGTIDLQTKNALVDFKTQKTKDGKFKKHDSWIWQLGAYNLHAKKDRACIIAISSTEPGVMKVFNYTKEELLEGTKTFTLLLKIFYRVKGLGGK